MAQRCPPYSTRIVDICPIRRGEANEAAARRGPRVNLQPLGKNLVDMVKKSQGVDHATSEPTDTTPAESAPGTSRAPVPPVNPTISNIGPDCFLKLQAQMAILLHHI